MVFEQRRPHASTSSGPSTQTIRCLCCIGQRVGDALVVRPEHVMVRLPTIVNLGRVGERGLKRGNRAVNCSHVSIIHAIEVVVDLVGQASGFDLALAPLVRVVVVELDHHTGRAWRDDVPLVAGVARR